MQPPPIPTKDTEHLRMLAICHYVVSGLSVLVIGFLLLHYTIMKMVFANPKMWDNAKEPPPFNPAEFMHLFQWFYLFAGIMIVIFAILTLLSGRFIHRRVNRNFSIVIGGMNCLHFPFGTLLGIFTLIILTKDSVMRMYSNSKQSDQT